MILLDSANPADIEQIAKAARTINNEGALATIGATYIILSVIVMLGVFMWFKSIIKQLLDDNKQSIKELLAGQQRVLEGQSGIIAKVEGKTDTLGEQLDDLTSNLTEGLRNETQLRIRNLSGFAFDLAVEQVCRLIKKCREENHIDDHAAEAAKIRKALQVIHNDRCSRFDTFTYKGKPLSKYCNQAWVEQVAQVVEGEIYNPDGANNGRAYNNVKLAYDNIKTDFYQRLNE